ncbi:MAG: LytTR family DNA-binding domain-containing protein [bacterium]
MNVIVVDDEKPAREELVWLLEQCEGVQVVGQAAGADDALELVKNEDIDLVFLDIDMPGIGGMRLAELLYETEGSPEIVFVTAYEHHAVDAFGVAALDYVLKPARLERLQKAVARARKKVEPPAVRPSKPLSRISVEERGAYRVIPIDEILFFESEDGIVVVQTRQKRFITDFSLKFLEQNLDPDAFFRSHRSYIIRLDAIESIAPWGAGTYKLILDRANDVAVPLARARATELKALIPWSANVFED